MSAPGGKKPSGVVRIVIGVVIVVVLLVLCGALGTPGRATALPLRLLVYAGEILGSVLVVQGLWRLRARLAVGWLAAPVKILGVVAVVGWLAAAALATVAAREALLGRVTSEGGHHDWDD